MSTPPILRRQMDYQEEIQARTSGRLLQYAVDFFRLSQRGAEDWSVSVQVTGTVLAGTGQLDVILEGFAGVTLGELARETIAISTASGVFFTKLFPSDATNPDDVRVRLELRNTAVDPAAEPLRVNLEYDVGYAAQPQSVFIRNGG